MKRILVLGAGIAGLTLAWSLKRQGYDVKILEKNTYPGGWLSSSVVKGYFFDHGPHSFRTKGKGTATLSLIEELGLQGEIAIPSPSAKNRFLWNGSSLQKLPSNLAEALASPFFWRSLPGCIRELFVGRSTGEDESVESFARRRFGSYIADNFFDPLTAGIYAGAAARLSMRSSFPEVWNLEKKERSLLLHWLKPGKSRSPPEPPAESAFVREMQNYPMLAFRRGFQTLVDRLARECQSVLVCDAEVLEICSLPLGIQIKTAGGDYEADLAVSTLPHPALAKLLPCCRHLFRQIPAASIETVHLGYPQRVLNRNGFGYLVPSHWRQGVFGMIWDSCVFPEQNSFSEQTRLTVIADKGGWQGKKGEALAREVLSRHLGVDAEPEHIEVRELPHAIIHFPVDYWRLAEAIRSASANKFPRLFLAGTAFCGVAVNDAVAFGKSFGSNPGLNLLTADLETCISG